MFSHWRKLIMTTVMVLASASAHSGIAAPKSETKGASEPHEQIKLALNKKKQKKQSQTKRNKKATKGGSSKQTAANSNPNSRWQAPAGSNNATETGTWIPKNNPKNNPKNDTKQAKAEAGKKSKSTGKASAKGSKKAAKHHAKAMKKPAATPSPTAKTANKTPPKTPPKSPPKTPVVSITPPDTAPTQELKADEKPEQAVAEAQKPEPKNKTEPTAPKAKPAAKKGLSAKSLKAQKRPPMADIEAGPDSMADSDSNAGASFLMLLTFLVASAGTFVYFKRREELNKAAGRPTPKPTAPAASKSTSAAKKAESQVRSMPPTPPPAIPQPEETPAALATTALIPPTEPCTFERFAEMQVALSCWIEQGTDAMSSMQTFFNIGESEWLTISSYWNQRYLADDELIRQFNNLAPDFRAKYGGTAA